MKREFITTGDGSKTIHLPQWNEHYHSKHGAMQEALHVFIQEGLLHFQSMYPNETLHLLEIGFGTGLNALLTWKELNATPIKVRYEGVEAYPVSKEEILQLNYAEQAKIPPSKFLRLHDVPWEEDVPLDKNFTLHKTQKRFEELSYRTLFNLIYFDAFGARVQPELWTEGIFQKMYDALRAPGVLVTYAAKGSVRRAMQAVGFTVERLPGPPGKREMLRATKKL